MMQNGFKTTKDRRRKPDILVKWVNWSVGIGWCLIIAILGITTYAKPEDTNMFYQMFNVKLRTTWNYSLINTAFYLLIFLFIFSLVSILFNAMRQRRKSDKFNKSLIFHAIASLVGIFIFLIYFI